MVATIIFLGTAGDHYVVGKQYRSSGGIIIKIDDNQFHLDPGPGSLIKSKEFNVNLRENTALLVSHNHLGHSNDANAVISAMTYAGLDRKGVLIAPNSFVNGNEDMTPGLTKYHRNCVEKIIVTEPGKRIGIENLEIVTLPASHLDPDAVGFKFYTPDFVLSYSGDTKYTNDLVRAYENSDILILNVSNPGNEKSDKLNVEDAIKIISKIEPKLAVITHFGIKMIKADPIIQAREIQRATGIQVIAAKDGMVITPGSYSAHSKQKTLLDMGRYKKKIMQEKLDVDISPDFSEEEVN